MAMPALQAGGVCGCAMAAELEPVRMNVVGGSSAPGCYRYSFEMEADTYGVASIRCPGLLRRHRRLGLQENLSCIAGDDPPRHARCPDHRCGARGLDRRPAG